MAKWGKSCQKNAGEQRAFTATDLISFKSKKIKGILSKLNILGPINIELGEPRIQFSFKTASGKSIVFYENCLADIQSSS